MLPESKLDTLIARHAEVEAQLSGQLAGDVIDSMDDNRFRVREAASRELAKIGEPAVPLLRAAVARTNPPWSW